MSDNSLQKAVLDQLQWDPSVNAAHIGVTAKDGVVTLSGDVSSYAEKWAAEQAARRVYGVKGLADEIKVRSPFEVDDTEITQKAVQALSWDIEVPASKVTVMVAWTGISNGTLPKPMSASSKVCSASPTTSRSSSRASRQRMCVPSSQRHSNAKRTSMKAISPLRWMAGRSHSVAASIPGARIASRSTPLGRRQG
jgi:hypothetical protein